MTSPLLLLGIPAALAGSGMPLIPDPWLILIQTVPFLVALFVLSNVVFHPMIRYLEDRDAATVGAREQAARLQHEADVRLARYEAQLLAARGEVATLRAARRQEALDRRERALAHARSEADRKVKDALDVIDGERDLAAQELERMARILAHDITDRVLGRPAQA